MVRAVLAALQGRTGVMPIVVYVSLITILIVYEFRRKALKIDALSFFHVFFLLSYLIPGLLWSIYPDHELWDRYSLGYNPAGTYTVLFLVAFSYCLIITSFALLERFRPTYYLSIQLKPNTVNAYYSYSAVLLLLIGLSIFSAGSIEQYIKHAIAHRHREASYGIGTYLKYFIFPSSVIMLGLFLMTKHTKGSGKALYILFNVIFVVATLIFLVSTGGRRNLIIVVLLASMLYYALSDRISIKMMLYVLSGFTFSIFVMAYYRDITFLWAKKGVGLDELQIVVNPSILDYVVGVFSYYQHYFYTIYESVHSSSTYGVPRLGLDWIRVLLTIFPGVRIEDLDLLHVESVPDVINIHHFGGGPGYIPPGWIGLALMNGGLAWLGLKSILIGATASMLSNKNYQNIDKSPAIIFVYFLVFYLWHTFFVVDVPLNIGANFLGYYFLALLMPVIVRVTLRRRS